LGVLLTVIVLTAFANVAGAGDDDSNVIEAITGETITVGGITYSLADDVKVNKKGYDFTINDLRPGWKIKFKERRGEICKIDVIGISSTIRFPQSNGVKTTIAVGRLRLGNLPPEIAQASVDIQSAVESILLATLQASNRFVVIDIRSRDELLNEVDYSQTAYVNREISTEVGRQIPADYIVRGHIMSFGQTQSGGGGFGAFGVKMGSKKTTISLKMQLTVEEVVTGITTESFTEELEYQNKGSALSLNVGELASGLSGFAADMESLGTLSKIAGTGVQMSNNSYYESPVGEIFGIVVNRLVEQLVRNNDQKPWSSVIVTIMDDRAIVRGGLDVGLHRGDVLDVFKSTNDLIDPESGLSLGQISAPIGRVVIDEVQDKVSIATYMGDGAPERGDRCELTSANRGGVAGGAY